MTDGENLESKKEMSEYLHSLLYYRRWQVHEGKLYGIFLLAIFVCAYLLMQGKWQ